MKFEQIDLLSGDELFRLFNTESPNERASIVCKKLLKYLFLDEPGNLYTFNIETVCYTKKSKRGNDNLIYTTVTDFVCQSFKAIDEAARLKIESKVEKRSQIDSYIKGKLSTKAITCDREGYKSQLFTYLTREDVKLDEYTWKIHFRNGYMNLKNHKFYKRQIGVDNITYFIDADYKKSTKENVDKIQATLKKIYPNQKDKDFALSYLGKALIGQPEVDQDSLFFLGKGSGGKSTLLELMNIAFKEYVHKFTPKMFEDGNSKIDKILNRFDQQKYIRVAEVDEFSDKKVDPGLFKDVINGVVETTKLYSDGDIKIKIYAKLAGTANTMPRFNIQDTGTSRRFRGITHVSKFVDSPEEVDEANNIYLKDKHLCSSIQNNPNLINAIADIFFSYCKDYYDGRVYEIPENVEETTSDVTTVNDFIQDFIDTNLEITNDPLDRISKDLMMKLFNEAQTQAQSNKHLSQTQLLSLLKEKDIKYGAKLRSKSNAQGCYTGVKVRELPESTAVIYSDKKENKTDQLKEYQKQIELLQKQIKELTEKTQPKKIVKKVEKIEQTTDDDEEMLKFEGKDPFDHLVKHANNIVSRKVTVKKEIVKKQNTGSDLLGEISKYSTLQSFVN